MRHIRVGIAFKDFACWLMNASSVGLNVAGYTTAQVLRENGIDATVFPVRHNVDLVEAIDHYNENHRHPLTHVVISAPWLSVPDLKSLVENFKNIKFVVLSHSNVGFLQADADGVRLLREYQELEQWHKNLRVGGNSFKFVRWMRTAYGRPVVYLPNLYPTPKFVWEKRWDGFSTIKIGAFGAVRPYKNFMTAAAASIIIQKLLSTPVEFHMSAGGEGDAMMTMPAIEAMLADTGVTLVKHEWSYWNKFITLVQEMDLLMQPSYTESFNLITADGIASGIPSVVSSAIVWAPDEWKADSDSAMDVAGVGVQLLTSKSSDAGIKALTKSNERGIIYWKSFLGIDVTAPERLSWWKKLLRRMQ